MFSLNCPNCGGQVDDADHNFNRCPYPDTSIQREQARKAFMAEKKMSDEQTIATLKAAFPGERAQLQERTAEWLSTWTNAPFGVITEMVEREDGGPGLGRQITFGLPGSLDAILTIWSTKRMDLLYNGQVKEFRGDYAETEFRNYCGEQFGAPALTEKELDAVIINMASTPAF